MRGGERFYSQGRHLSRIFPYKEKKHGLEQRLVSKGSVSVSDWTRLPDLSFRTPRGTHCTHLFAGGSRNGRL